MFAINYAYIVFSFLGALGMLLPLPLHIKAQNTGTIIMIFWGMLGLLTGATNAAIFAKTSANIAPNWCDFASVVGYIYPIGFTAGSLCLLRRLESIASTRQVSQSGRDRKKSLIVDLLIGIGLPILVIPLHFVVQGHRADVIEAFGCVAPLYLSVASIFLFQLWQIGLNLVSCIYAGLTIRWFFIRRKQFSAVLASSNSGLSVNKYLRLVAMVSIEILLWFPLSLYIFFDFTFVVGTIRPYISWQYVHDDYGMIYSYNREDIDTERLIVLEIGRWCGVLGAAIFFVFLALTPDSIAEYKRWCQMVVKRLSTMPRKRKQSMSDRQPDTPMTVHSFGASTAASDREKFAFDDMSMMQIAQKDQGDVMRTPPSKSHTESLAHDKNVRIEVERYVV